MTHAYATRTSTITEGAPARVPLVSRMVLAGVLECGGGLLLVLGLFTRPVAVVLLLEMLYALIFAFLAGNGAGPASLDSRRAG
jgi:putative oxidoreductase